MRPDIRLGRCRANSPFWHLVRISIVRPKQGAIEFGNLDTLIPQLWDFNADHLAVLKPPPDPVPSPVTLSGYLAEVPIRVLKSGCHITAAPPLHRCGSSAISLARGPKPRRHELGTWARTAARRRRCPAPRCRERSSIYVPAGMGPGSWDATPTLPVFRGGSRERLARKSDWERIADRQAQPSRNIPAPIFLTLTHSPSLLGLRSLCFLQLWHPCFAFKRVSCIAMFVRGVAGTLGVSKYVCMCSYVIFCCRSDGCKLRSGWCRGQF